MTVYIHSDVKSVLHRTSDDDGAPNTYDYDDSFIDNEDVSEESSVSNQEEDDSDWDPEEMANVKDLVRESKAFQKNKKMIKPAKTKV